MAHRRRKSGGSREGEDAWIFVALKRHPKLVLTYDLGKRTVSATNAEKRFQLTTDGLKAYNYAVGMQLEDRVDYAQLIKIYKQESRWRKVASSSAERLGISAD